MRYSAIQFGANPSWPKAFFFAILALPIGFAAGTADAEESGAPKSKFDSKFSVSLGGFFPQIDSSFSLNPSSTGGSGSTISMEDDLGLASSSVSPWVNFSWRFLPRHQVHVEWFQLNRDGSATGGPFRIGETQVFAGASLSSKMDMNLGRVTYGYSIMRRENLDLSFLVGTHIVTAKATVTATGTLSVGGDPPVAGRTRTESSSTATFPLGVDLELT